MASLSQSEKFFRERGRIHQTARRDDGAVLSKRRREGEERRQEIGQAKVRSSLKSSRRTALVLRIIFCLFKKSLKLKTRIFEQQWRADKEEDPQRGDSAVVGGQPMDAAWLDVGPASSDRLRAFFLHPSPPPPGLPPPPPPLLSDHYTFRFGARQQISCLQE